MQCVRLPDFQGVRPGAYVCQCPAGARPSPTDRRASDERRERLVEQLMTRASANATFAFDQLTLLTNDDDDAEQLANRAHVLDRLQQQQHSHHARPPVHHPPGGAGVQQPHWLSLGAQLETDANLEWFSRGLAQLESDGWPSQGCQVCQQHQRTGNSPAGSNNNSTPVEDHYHDTCVEFRPFTGSQLNWIRPLVAAVQSLCLLVTLILIGILLRIRKSRVGVAHSPRESLAGRSIER